MFTVLPLPLLNAQPIHIHALFSISPDRAKLSVEDPNITDHKPSYWNNFLFKEPIPAAWSSLLSFIAVNHQTLSTFEWWPRTSRDSRDPLKDVVTLVVDQIRKHDLAVFPTVAGYRTVKEGLLGTGKEDLSVRNALDEALVPMIRAPPEIRASIKYLFLNRMISPASVSSQLNGVLNQVARLSNASKDTILEYLITGKEKVAHEGLEIFPFEDGHYKSVSNGSAFVHRSDDEASFFAMQPSANIDMKKLSSKTSLALHEMCSKKFPACTLKYRSVQDFAEFCLSYIFDGASLDDDVLALAIEPQLIAKAWKWINVQVSTLQEPVIASLWLLPLSDGTYRKLKPLDPSCAAMIAKKGELGNLLHVMDRSPKSRAPVLLDLERSGLKHGNKLLMASGTLVALSLLHSDNPIDLTEWLRDNAGLVATLCDKEKEIILAHLAKLLPGSVRPADRAKIRAAIQSLMIFKKLMWQNSNDRL
jgi:sacsin